MIIMFYNTKYDVHYILYKQCFKLKGSHIGLITSDRIWSIFSI